MTCIEWTGARRADGYGTVGAHGLAHRHVWEREVGPIPPGAVLHHECENPSCVNIDHLRLVASQSDHARLHDHITTAQRVANELKRAATHCKRGHLLDERERERYADGGRRCRVCKQERDRMRSRAA